MCAKTMLRCMWSTLSRWNLGLSATPKRQDGLESILKATLGEISFRTERRDENVQVELYTSPGFFENPFDTSMPAIGVWLSKLTYNERRNQFIAETVANLARDPKRNILIFSDRIKHLKNLMEKVQILCGPEKKMSLYTGEMKAAERQSVENYPLLFATFGLAGIGLDLPQFNTAVFTTPHVADTTEQATGKIKNIPWLNLHLQDVY